MAQIHKLGGTVIEIGGLMSNLPEVVTAADFSGQTFTEIGGLVTLGTIAVTDNTASVVLMKSSFERMFKTTQVGGAVDNTHVPMPLDAGQVKFKNAALDRCGNYAIRVRFGADCTPTATVTISVASPAVVTWTNHGLVAGQPVTFATSGTMPTGLTAGTVYYVTSTSLTANSFTVAATAGGAAIAVTAAGTGAITASAPTPGLTVMFAALINQKSWQGGDATAANLITLPMQINSNLVEV